jgi:hypothetical protein
VRAVNLLPADERRGSRPPSRRLLAIAGAVVVVGGVGAWAYTTHQSATDAHASLASAQAQVTELQSRISALGTVQQRSAVDVGQARTALVGLTAARPDWERVMRQAIVVTPHSVWYDGMTGQAGSSASTGTASTTATSTTGAGERTTLHLEGFALSVPQLARLMVRLDAIPGAGQSNVSGIETQLKGTRRVIHFRLDLPVTGDPSAGAASPVWTDSEATP